MVLIIGVRQDLMLILNFNWPNWKRNIKPIYPQIWGLTCGFSIRGTFINRGKGLIMVNICKYQFKWQNIYLEITSISFISGKYMEKIGKVLNFTPLQAEERVNMVFCFWTSRWQICCATLHGFVEVETHIHRSRRMLPYPWKSSRDDAIANSFVFEQPKQRHLTILDLCLTNTWDIISHRKLHFVNTYSEKPVWCVSSWNHT